MSHERGLTMHELKRAIITSAVSRIEESENNTVKQRYRFAPDFIGFSGHFPGYPILPAFIQILMALVVIEQHRDCRLLVSSVEKAKFHIPLRPDQEIEVECQQQKIGNMPGCAARLVVSDGLASSFRIAFNAKEDIR